jgi:S-adenosylmethionine hydrolase
MSRAPLIALLTDFGTADGYVGVMKGVVLGIVPRMPLVDISHEVPPQDIAAGAWVLSTSWRFFPSASIFLCVVDPGVGGARRAIALRAGAHLFVGPDNGLFSYVLDRVPGEAAVVLDNPRYQLPAPSATFHGRDIFAPGAAHLAAGVPLASLGTPLEPATLVRLPSPRSVWHGASLHAQVLHVDVFGNLITSVPPELTSTVLAEPQTLLRIAGQTISARGSTFADGPSARPFMLRDSSGHLAIAIREASAASALGARRGDLIVIDGLERA